MTTERKERRVLMVKIWVLLPVVVFAVGLICFFIVRLALSPGQDSHFGETEKVLPKKSLSLIVSRALDFLLTVVRLAQ
jgi:hypothetical protein